MSTESAAPRHARAVYAGLIAMGIVFALIAAATISIIAYNYVTRIELREPPPLEQHTEDDAQGALPTWVNSA